ncbi:NfeD family protein [Primorskyibacter sp. S87]|uniref:NfeD family protein n=1 Tax=Primorskyibacter sp. S87 TaxID=3415126 RepID=UPI003C7A7A54
MTEPLWAIWWVWLCVALVLAILEVVVPGFVFLGFAIGAAAMAALILGSSQGLTFLGELHMLGLPVLLLVFAALSLISWLVLRRVFSLPKGQVKRFHNDIND